VLPTAVLICPSIGATTQQRPTMEGKETYYGRKRDLLWNTAVLICPSIGATSGTNSGFGDFQWKSPFDSCPATLATLCMMM